MESITKFCLLFLIFFSCAILVKSEEKPKIEDDDGSGLTPAPDKDNITTTITPTKTTKGFGDKLHSGMRWISDKIYTNMTCVDAKDCEKLPFTTCQHMETAISKRPSAKGFCVLESWVVPTLAGLLFLLLLTILICCCYCCCCRPKKDEYKFNNDITMSSY